MRAGRILHRGVQDGAPQAEIETEHDARGADETDDGLEIGEGVKALQPDDHLARAAREHLERAADLMGAGVDQECTGEPGFELRQLPNGCPLYGAALNRVQIGHVALLHAERLAERLEEGQGISLTVGCQHRPHRLIA